VVGHRHVPRTSAEKPRRPARLKCRCATCARLRTKMRAGGTSRHTRRALSSCILERTTFAQGDPGQPFVQAYADFARDVPDPISEGAHLRGTEPDLSGTNRTNAKNYLTQVISTREAAGDTNLALNRVREPDEHRVGVRTSERRHARDHGRAFSNRRSNGSGLVGARQF